MNELLGTRRSKFVEFLLTEGIDYEAEVNQFEAPQFYDSD